ncbi:MAG TPA: methylated-DNA--[protein]-cysteine S-methyltransferase [Thermoanaerobaculia bacterium]|nr:methylated-DNA--[protein]-cysteine S-methyltransferase [Thermoanaerobaculia bacterium]
MEAQQRLEPVPESTGEVFRVLMPSPIGTLGVELAGTKITRVTLEPGEAGFIALHQIDGSDFLDEVFGRLAEYFAGARRKLGLELDLCPSGLALFARRVLKEAAKIPYGKTRTCREIAEAAGRPDACQEVLAILRENPLPIVIPCHRVLAEDGGLGDYVGGSRRKRWLLDMESQSTEI